MHLTDDELREAVAGIDDIDARAAAIVAAKLAKRGAGRRAEDKPANAPSPEQIARQALELRLKQQRAGQGAA